MGRDPRQNVARDRRAGADLRYCNALGDRTRVSNQRQVNSTCPAGCGLLAARREPLPSVSFVDSGNRDNHLRVAPEPVDFSRYRSTRAAPTAFPRARCISFRC
jgi:hypothetical protein